jgi:hypothetical protein
LEQADDGHGGEGNLGGHFVAEEDEGEVGRGKQEGRGEPKQTGHIDKVHSLLDDDRYLNGPLLIYLFVKKLLNRRYFDIPDDVQHFFGHFHPLVLGPKHLSIQPHRNLRQEIASNHHQHDNCNCG